MEPHPNAYTWDELAFLDELRRRMTRIPYKDFERLEDLLGRVPTYETLPNGEYDYDKPITVNNRFQDSGLAAGGIENVMFHGRLFGVEVVEP